MVLIFMILKICYSVNTLMSVERLYSPLYAVEDFFVHNACVTMVLVFLMEINNNNLIVYFL